MKECGIMRLSIIKSSKLLNWSNELKNVISEEGIFDIYRNPGKILIIGNVELIFTKNMFENPILMVNRKRSRISFSKVCQSEADFLNEYMAEIRVEIGWAEQEVEEILKSRAEIISRRELWSTRFENDGVYTFRKIHNYNSEVKQFKSNERILRGLWEIYQRPGTTKLLGNLDMMFLIPKNGRQFYINDKNTTIIFFKQPQTYTAFCNAFGELILECIEERISELREEK